MPGTISAIVLAAGRSRRFGRDKRLELIGQQPMFLAVACRLKDLIPDTLVVLGPQDSIHQTLLAERGIAATCCTDAALGMGHSLAHAVAQRAEATGWLVMPADMPFISSDTIERILAVCADHDLAAPVHENQRGHPVWFSRRFKAELCRLSGDEGGRSILRSSGTDGAIPGSASCPSRAALWRVPVNDAGCLRDVDYPADLPAGEMSG